VLRLSYACCQLLLALVVVVVLVNAVLVFVLVLVLVLVFVCVVSVVGDISWTSLIVCVVAAVY